MFCIIIFVAATVLSVYGYKRISKHNKKLKLSERRKNPIFGIICAIVAVYACITFIVQGVNGMIDHPYLVNELARIETLQQRITDIRGSNYDYTENGALVAGSIENWKQSTNLSTYIAKLAEVEANYNGYLEECKLFKNSFPLYFFMRGWAISNKIDSLKYVN